MPDEPPVMTTDWIVSSEGNFHISPILTLDRGGATGDCFTEGLCARAGGDRDTQPVADRWMSRDSRNLNAAQWSRTVSIRKQQQAKAVMKDISNEMIISGHNLDLTDSLKTMVREKMQKLFEHETRIQRLRIEVEYNPNSTKQDEFCAKGQIEIKGRPLVAHADSDDMYKSIDLLEHKLDRMLRRRSRLRVAKRKIVHSVDLPAYIPKVAAP